MEAIIYKGGVYYRLYSVNPRIYDPLHHCYYWHYKDCGGDIYIGSDATLYCPKCGASAPVLHLELGDLEGTSGLVPLADLIAMMMDMVYMTGNVWMAELLMNIEVSAKSILNAETEINERFKIIETI